MKRMIVFITKCLVVSGGAILLLILFNLRYLQVMDDPYADAHKYDYIGSVYKDIQICNIGSSHGEYGFYYEELSKQSGYECFNFAMSSQTFNYDYAILSMYKDYLADDCLLFIPISYFSFNNEVTNEAEREFLNAKYYTFLSPKYIPDYDIYVDIVTHYYPVLSAGEDIFKLFPSLSLRAFAAEASSGETLPSPAEFQKKAIDRYHRHMENKEDFFLQERIDNLYELLAFCDENHITPILITTPYTGYYSGLVSTDFKDEFGSTIQTIATDTKTPYYDYSEDPRLSGHLEYFSDGDHLNTEGAAYFMDILREEVPEVKSFLNTAKPLHEGDANWKHQF